MRKLILTPSKRKTLILKPKPNARVKLPAGATRRNIAMKKMADMEMFTEKRKNSMNQMRSRLRTKILT